MSNIEQSINILAEPGKSIGKTLMGFYEVMKSLESDQHRGGKQATKIVMTIAEIEKIIENIELKVGDKIDIGNFITELKEIKYCPYAEMNLYWFYNELGQYKFNLLKFITKIHD